MDETRGVLVVAWFLACLLTGGLALIMPGFNGLDLLAVLVCSSFVWYVLRGILKGWY